MEQILINLIGSLDLFLIVIAMVTFTAVKNILKKILGLPTGKNNAHDIHFNNFSMMEDDFSATESRRRRS
jgi:hypothetical protein